jgi:hypothetical protein
VRDRHLGPALAATVGQLDPPLLDGQLAQYVDRKRLMRLSSYGVRGEVLLPVPCVLEARPCLLGYYRLLYGLSQKEFYNKGPFGRFRAMEDDDHLRPGIAEQLPALCASLVQTGQQLLDALPRLSYDMVHELQLLTFGPQLRGSRNTRIGQAATVAVFDLIKRLVSGYIVHATPRVLTLRNDSDRRIAVEFASDPDIRITESADSGTLPLVSVEIKGGGDRSNIHNRIGEAEKSHQKAKQRGFAHFWTILAARVDLTMAQRESPTTTRFFHLSDILDPAHEAHGQFRDALASQLGIRVSRRTARRKSEPGR